MLFDYECNKCGFKDEYSTSPSVPKDMKVPSKCPECGKGKMKKLFSIECKGKAGIDVVNGFEYEYGKKNWKQGKSPSEQASILMGDKNPY